MDDFRLCLPLVFDAERNGTFHAVQVIVQPGFGRDEQGRGNAQKIQALCQEVLEKVFYGFDRDLGIMQIQPVRNGRESLNFS
jgi:hypothetical protein